MISISYFDAIKASPVQAWSGSLLPLLGVISLIYAFTYKVKILIATGLLSLALLVIDFIRLKSALSNAGAENKEIADQMSLTFEWGFYVISIAAVLLIVAGIRSRFSLGAS